MLRVTRRQFEHAYRKHKDASGGVNSKRSISHVLLLIYAIECGIKTLLMKKSNAKCWEDIHNDRNRPCGNGGHNLAEGLKNLGVPASLAISETTTIPDRDGRNERVSVAELHQACRYGIAFEQRDYERLQTQLNAVLEWLKSRLGD